MVSKFIIPNATSGCIFRENRTMKLVVMFDRIMYNIFNNLLSKCQEEKLWEKQHMKFKRNEEKK